MVNGSLRLAIGTPARRVLAVLVFSALLGAAFIALVLGLAACSPRIGASLRTDGGARVSIEASIPDPLGVKFRKLGASPPDYPLFDAAAIRKAFSARKDLALVELSIPSPNSLRAAVDVGSVSSLGDAKEFAGTGFIAVETTESWTELRVRLERGSAASLVHLFPGIDPRLMDALSPPALEEEPVTAAEYRTMLKSVLGEKAMPSMEAAAIDLTIRAPNQVLASSCGSLSGQVLSLRIPVIDALVLEKPIVFSLRWKK